MGQAGQPARGQSHYLRLYWRKEVAEDGKWKQPRLQRAG
jgi:hypothetical protein